MYKYIKKKCATCDEIIEGNYHPTKKTCFDCKRERIRKREAERRKLLKAS